MNLNYRQDHDLSREEEHSSQSVAGRAEEGSKVRSRRVVESPLGRLKTEESHSMD